MHSNIVFRLFYHVRGIRIHVNTKKYFLHLITVVLSGVWADFHRATAIQRTGDSNQVCNDVSMFHPLLQIDVKTRSY